MIGRTRIARLGAHRRTSQHSATSAWVDQASDWGRGNSRCSHCLESAQWLARLRKADVAWWL